LGEIRIVNQLTNDNVVSGLTQLSYTNNFVNNIPLIMINANVQFINSDTAQNVLVYNGKIEQDAELTTGQISGKGFTWKQSAQLNLPNNTLQINNWIYIPNFLQNWSEIELINNAIITHDIAENINDIVSLNTNSLKIDNASKIDLTAKGMLKLSGTSGTFGGSYGGLGAVKNGGVSNPVYGDELAPNHVGVGGSWNTSRGGGGIKITSDFLNIDGNIYSNAIASNSNGGRASGGSIWLETGAINVSGLLQANGGGEGSNAGVGGSGGRIAIYYGSNQGSNLALRAEAKGGVSNSGPAGGDGTVHLQQEILNTQIVWSSPKATNQQIDRIRVHFNQDINPIDFTTTDVQLVGNTGNIAIDSIADIGNGVFDVVLSSALTVEDDYQLLISATVLDQNNNGTTGESPADEYSTTIVVDFSAPISPVISNRDIAPASNLVNSNITTVHGMREPNTSLFVNGELYVALGSSDWSVILELPPGSSTWEFTSVDAAGNISASVSVIYFFAEDKPAIISMTPSNDSCLASAPASIQLSLYDFAGNGFDEVASVFDVTENGQNITGEPYS